MCGLFSHGSTFIRERHWRYSSPIDVGCQFENLTDVQVCVCGCVVASVFFVFDGYKDVKQAIRRLPKVGVGNTYGLPQTR